MKEDSPRGIGDLDTGSSQGRQKKYFFS